MLLLQRLMCKQPVVANNNKITMNDMSVHIYSTVITLALLFHKPVICFMFFFSNENNNFLLEIINRKQYNTPKQCNFKYEVKYKRKRTDLTQQC